MSPHTKPEDILEDAPAAADLRPTSVPKASEPPSPENAAEDVPTLVILTPLEPLFALAPPVPVAWELLLDVITAELLVPPEPPDAAFSPDPPALREKSPKGKEVNIHERYHHAPDIVDIQNNHHNLSMVKSYITFIHIVALSDLLLYMEQPRPGGVLQVVAARGRQGPVQH
ncbi:hypothetical protein INR49_031105 [Caranx melampygus]|nr:hypothetical protein INR49_031105 [Caranx melampygus]